MNKQSGRRDFLKGAGLLALAAALPAPALGQVATDHAERQAADPDALQHRLAQGAEVVAEQLRAQVEGRAAAIR
ncbi:twin-arginine translocation signal domain-containing protein, partial [Acinetobacter baumannii]